MTSRGGALMRVAVPEWQGRVSPVFDVAEHVILVDVDDASRLDRQWESMRSLSPRERARRLAEWEVDVLICGAISRSLSGELAARGVQVVPLVCGDVHEVLQAYRDGTLEEERFMMPGCGRMRRRGRRRRSRRGGGCVGGGAEQPGDE